MTKIIFTLFLCWTLPAFGQYSKTRIGLKLLPGLTDSYDPNEQQNFQNRIHSRFTFNFGGQFIYAIKDSLLFIESGIYYTDRGSLQKDYVYKHYTSQGFYNKTSDIYVHNYYFSLPILFRIERRHFYASFGATVDYYTHTKWVWTAEEDKVEKSNWRQSGFLNCLAFGAALNIGTQIKLTERLQVFIEGDINPSDFYRDHINKKYYFFWNYLLGTGLTFKL